MAATNSALMDNWRTVNIDALDPDSTANFDVATLAPAVVPVSTQEVQSLATQIRQLLRGGDSEGALRGALESAPYGADERGKEIHSSTVIEILQSTRQSEMTPLLQKIYQSDGGSELLDVLMKYMCSVVEHVLQILCPKRSSRAEPADVHSTLADLVASRYKGMAHTSSVGGGAAKQVQPQPTGFSQIHARSLGGGEGGGQAMSVLLSWHEKVVEIAGAGSIVRVMTDRRTV